MDGRRTPPELASPLSLEDQVMSEVHVGCPPRYSAPHISHFTFTIPSGIHQEWSTCFDNLEDKPISMEHMIDLDEDGDLILTRKSRLVGILLARVAKTVYITDRGADILDNCAKNVELNSGAFRSHSSVHVRELDWQSLWPPSIGINIRSRNEYLWTPSEVEDVKEAFLLLAADVIYSDTLTDAFFSVLEKLMPCGSEKVLYLALEKRYNFSLTDLDVVANGYLHFRNYLREEESEGIEEEPLPKFVGKRINLSTIPQYISGYDRGNDVELWKITYVKRKTHNH